MYLEAIKTVVVFNDHGEGSLAHLADAVSDSPGQEDTGQDLKACQNQRRRYDSWNTGDKTNSEYMRIE